MPGCGVGVCMPSKRGTAASVELDRVRFYAATRGRGCKAFEVLVEWEDRTLELFTIDLEQRGQSIDHLTASPRKAT